MALRYDLLGCALHGHHVVGDDAATVEHEDHLLAKPGPGDRRWLRCLRCDAWELHDAPGVPSRPRPPRAEEVELPLRGRALRDRFVLRLIALDRVLHVIGLGLLGVGVLVFIGHRTAWSPVFGQIVAVLQGNVGGAVGQGSSMLGKAQHAFDLPASTLRWLAVVLFAYAALEGVEAVGLWFAKRWAEYLTFVATTVLLVPEIYELSEGASPTKIIALLINVAVVVYLLIAKRLFGLRGGGRAEEALREKDATLAPL